MNRNILVKGKLKKKDLTLLFHISSYLTIMLVMGMA